MEKIPTPRDTSEALRVESDMPAGLAETLDRETTALKVSPAERKDKEPSWRKKAGAVLFGITILASVMAGTAEEAHARGRHHPRLVWQPFQPGPGPTFDDFYREAKEKRQRDDRIEEEAIRKMQDMQDEAVRRRQNMEADAARAKLQLEEQRVRNFNDEIRTAKTDAEVAFIKRKYGMR